MLKALSHSTHILLTTAFILILPVIVLGQGSTPARGFQPGGSYALSDIETINTTNGNLILNLTLGKLAPGRGGLSGQLSLHYDSKLYDSRTQYYEDWEHPIFGQPQVVIRNMLMTSDQGGWHYGTGYELQLIDRMSQYPPEIAPQYPATETIRHYKVKVATTSMGIRRSQQTPAAYKLDLFTAVLVGSPISIRHRSRLLIRPQCNALSRANSTSPVAS